MRILNRKLSLFILMVLLAGRCTAQEVSTGTVSPVDAYSIDIKIPYFLGNEQRSYYGKGPVPETLDVLWKIKLGCGRTLVWKEMKEFCGTGWPGQAVLVEEEGRLYVVTGALNGDVWKLDADTGEVIWTHRFNNIIKGTPTLYVNPHARSIEEKGMVFCGSRRGITEIIDEEGTSTVIKSTVTQNYRAISLATGATLWAMNIPATASYSRDVDGNALVINDIMYLGAENGFFYIINPDPARARKKLGFLQPEILSKQRLYDYADIKKHKNNLVIESSPSYFEDKVYVTAGCGRVYAIDTVTRKVTWSFYIGSDLDASPVVTADGFLLVGVEKQYIKGSGGVFKLDPRRKGAEAVKWYFPVADAEVSDWEGGVLGSVAVNDTYNPDETLPALAAFCSLDGYFYVVSQDNVTGEKVQGPNLKYTYDTPKVIYKQKIGPSISTPIFIDNYLVACSYTGGVHIYARI